jgi:uncharacterized protein with FMN-binding domain
MTPKPAVERTNRVANGLVALSSAAVLTVYTAGYFRTRSAADRFAAASERRVAAPVAVIAMAPTPTPEPRMESGLDRPGVAPGRPSAAPAPAPQARTTRASMAPTASFEPTPATGAVATPAPPAATLESSTPLNSIVPTPAPPASVPADVSVSAAAPPAAPRAQYKDGTYLGWGTSRHGDIQASVVIEGGRIISANIAQCLTRYSCSWISPLPPQVVGRQSPEVDYVSGATQSTNAFYYAVVEALSKAK